MAVHAAQGNAAPIGKRTRFASPSCPNGLEQPEKPAAAWHALGCAYGVRC